MLSPVLRVLLVEDDDHRYEKIQSWSPSDVRLVWVTCAGSALGVLNHDKGDVYAGIMLDFDLYQKLHTTDRMPGTGADVAKKIIEVIDKDTPILVHSMNEEERYGVAKLLSEAGFYVTIAPMTELTKERLTAWLEDCRTVYQDRIAS